MFKEVSISCLEFYVIHISTAGVLHTEDCNIDRNTASRGAGIHMNHPDSVVNLTRVKLERNDAAISGGGIQVSCKLNIPVTC